MTSPASPEASSKVSGTRLRTSRSGVDPRYASEPRSPGSRHRVSSQRSTVHSIRTRWSRSSTSSCSGLMASRSRLARSPTGSNHSSSVPASRRLRPTRSSGTADAGTLKLFVAKDPTIPLAAGLADTISQPRLVRVGRYQGLLEDTPEGQRVTWDLSPSVRVDLTAGGPVSYKELMRAARSLTSMSDAQWQRYGAPHGTLNPDRPARHNGTTPTTTTPTSRTPPTAGNTMGEAIYGSGTVFVAGPNGVAGWVYTKDLNHDTKRKTSRTSTRSTRSCATGQRPYTTTTGTSSATG